MTGLISSLEEGAFRPVSRVRVKGSEKKEVSNEGRLGFEMG